LLIEFKLLFDSTIGWTDLENSMSDECYKKWDSRHSDFWF